MRRLALLCVLAACEQPTPATPAPVAPTPIAPAPITPTPTAVPTTPPPPAVAAILAEISPAIMHATVARLVGFGTRHTLSATDSETRGIGAARAWIRDELTRHAAARGEDPLRVSLDTHRLEPDGKRIDRPVEIINVIAELPGTMPAARARRYYVVGHYDSRASDPMDATSDAPGADDDASGTAVVLELARVLARHRFDATLVFMASAGEEQGLLGARRHAEAARQAGLQIHGVLSNDIVGDPSDPRGGEFRHHIRVFSENLPTHRDEATLAQIIKLSAFADSPARQLARHVADVGAWQATPVQARLVLRPDRFLRGGDHTAFTDNGFPAVRFTEVAENYDRQHQDVRVEGTRAYGDVLEFVDPDYLAGVARLNAAALIHLANAPSTPGDVQLVLTTLGNDTTLRWTASPEPDLAGYELLRRDTTAAVWQHADDLGDVTTITVPHSKDNWFFAVRAYDRDGYRSPAGSPRIAEH